MRISETIILPLLLLMLHGCSKVDQVDSVENRSQFVLEFEDKTIEVEEEAGTHFAATLGSKSRLYGLIDSARLVLIKGLGENQSLDEPQLNTLYVSFTGRFNGFRMSDTQFQSWLTTGGRNYVRDGDEEEGIGIIWFDENGVMWVSGKHVGERKYIEKGIIPDQAFPVQAQFQKNSKFSIVASKPIIPEPAHDYTQQVDMEFNCTLYNENMDSIVIKKGMFKTVLSFYNG